MTGSILVPLDGSAFGEHALPLAQRLARKARADLHLVHVHLPVQPVPYTDGIPLYDGQLEEEARAREEEYLASMANRTAEQAGVLVRQALLEGPVAQALSRYVEEEDIGLIVMTTHGRGGLSRAWLGSVADALVREVTIPILLLRPRKEAPEEAPVHEFRRILVPLDGSELAEAALDTAIELGGAADVEYTLLQVVVPPFILMPPRSAVLVDPDAGFAVNEGRADEYLTRVAERLRAEGLRVRAVVETYPSAALGVLQYARDNGVDLIAMATHGRVGLSRVALGSVSDKVLRGADVPVLLQRGVRAAPRKEQEGDDAARIGTPAEAGSVAPR